MKLNLKSITKKKKKILNFCKLSKALKISVPKNRSKGKKKKIDLKKNLRKKKLN